MSRWLRLLKHQTSGRGQQSLRWWSLVWTFFFAGAGFGYAADEQRFSSAADASLSAEPPNIILIYIDDFGWRDTGFNGSRFYQTPNMDRIANEGINFTDAYSNAPNCAPSRACLMTGLYSPRHGIYTVGNSDRGPAKQRKLIPVKNRTVLPGSFTTMAEHLQNAGYRTAFLGKWHLGEGDSTGPLGQGFDLNWGGLSWGHPKTYFSPYRNPELKDGPTGEYLTDRLSFEADQFIRQHVVGEEKNGKRSPFFVCLSHYAVHTPIQAKPEITEKYRARDAVDGQNNARYAAMIESVDQGMGRILKTLDDLNIAEETLVILYSDNGGLGGVTDNSPLRGSKGMLYEGGIRVPLAMRWPGKITAKTVSRVPVIGTDLFPTLAEVAGKPLAAESVDGKSLLPLMRIDGLFRREAIYWHFPAYLQGKKPRGARKRDPYFRTRPASAVRCGDWKLIEFFEDGGVELYNLAEDLSEGQNLASTHIAKRDDLLAQLTAWRKEVQAPASFKKNPRYRAAAAR